VDVEKFVKALQPRVYIMYTLLFIICGMCNLCMNKIGVAGGIWAWSVAACSCDLMKIVKYSENRCIKAFCHKSRIGLSVGNLVSSCSKCLIEVGVRYFGEIGRPSLFEFVPPPSIGEVFLVVSEMMSHDGDLVYWDVGVVLVGVSMSWVLGVKRSCF